jgi:hypothetical protein
MRIALTAVATALLGIGTAAQTQDPVADLVARTQRYVEQYRKDVSGVVGESTETQRVVRPDGTIKRQRVLVSDILLVQIDSVMRSFRDVISVDGKAVRNREERLRKLFVGQQRGVADQLRAVRRESSRYDISGARGPDTLLMPFDILRESRVSGFRFERTPDGLAFVEFRSPAMIRSKMPWSGFKDMFLRGHFVTDNDGRVRGATVSAASNDFTWSVETTYVENPAIALLVPLQSKESVRRTRDAKRDHTEVDIAYSNFRRFQVTTREDIALP